MRVNMLLSYHPQGWEQRINPETRGKNAFEEETEIDFLVILTTNNISAQCRMPKELHIYRQSALWSTRTLTLKKIFSIWLQSSHFLNSQVRKGMNANAVISFNLLLQTAPLALSLIFCDSHTKRNLSQLLMHPTAYFFEFLARKCTLPSMESFHLEWGYFMVTSCVHSSENEFLLFSKK